MKLLILKDILVFVAIFILIAGGVFYFLNKPVNTNSGGCKDCGESGWQKMNIKCQQTIFTKNDFKNCLMKFSWSSVSQNTSIEEIKEGYIEIGGKVFIYHQWAVDKDGNLYLLGQLG